MNNKETASNGLKIDLNTLESFYAFVSENLEGLENYYTTMISKKEREKLPFILFVIALYSNEVKK